MSESDRIRHGTAVAKCHKIGRRMFVIDSVVAEEFLYRSVAEEGYPFDKLVAVSTSSRRCWFPTALISVMYFLGYGV